jgi:hypothetical protein
VTRIAGSKRKRRHGVEVPERGERRHENTHTKTLLRNGAETMARAADNHSRRTAASAARASCRLSA